MTLNEWLSSNSDKITKCNYAKGLWGFVDFIRELIAVYDIDDARVVVEKSYEMSEPDIHGGMMDMPIVRISTDDKELDVTIRYDFSNFCDIYALVDHNNRKLGLPDIFKGQNRLFWDFIMTIESEHKERHLEEYVGSATYYLLPDSKELFTYISAILNYDAFCE